MKRGAIAVVTAIICICRLSPAPLSTFELPSTKRGETAGDLISFLSEKRERHSFREFGSAEIGAELREAAQRKVDEILGARARLSSGDTWPDTSIDEGQRRRRLLDLSELYIRQYVRREQRALQREQKEKSLFGEEYGTALTLESAGSSRDGVDRGEELLSRLLERERRLVEERLAWERRRDEEYRDRLYSYRREYLGTLEEREVWTGELEEATWSGTELWAGLFGEIEESRRRQGEAMRSWNGTHLQPYVASVEDSLRIRNEARDMLRKAELELYRGGDASYWNRIRNEFASYLEQSEEEYERLVREESEKILSKEELLLREAEKRLDFAEADAARLSRLCSYASGEIDRSELEGGTEAALASLLDLEKEAALTQRLGDELQRAERRRDAALDAVNRLRARDESASPVGEELRRVFEREHRLAALHESCTRAGEFLAAKIETRGDEYEKNAMENASILYDLFLVPATAENGSRTAPSAAIEQLSERRDPDRYRSEDGYFLQSAELWLNALESSEWKVKSLLREFALAYNHERDELEPGYSSQNAAYRTLSRKVGDSGERFLEARQRKAYGSVYKDEKKRVLYEFYRDYLECRDEASEGSLLWRAAVEDLGEVLFEGADRAAEKKFEKYKRKKKKYKKRAKALAVAAAAKAASFNFSAAAALGAAAAVAKLSADDMAAKAGDIKALRKNLRKSGMSGKNERRTFSRLLSGYSRTEEALCGLESELRLLTEEERGIEQWLSDWRAGTGVFDYAGVYFEDAVRAELQEAIGDGPHGEGFSREADDFEPKVTASVFLKAAQGASALYAERAAKRRRELWSSSYVSGTWEERSELLRYSLLRTETGRDAEKARELFLLRADRERRAFADEESRREAELQRRHARWEVSLRTVENEGRGYWDSAEEATECATEEWERNFRRGYETSERLWNRRHGELSRQGRRVLFEESSDSLRDNRIRALRSAGARMSFLLSSSPTPSLSSRPEPPRPDAETRAVLENDAKLETLLPREEAGGALEAATGFSHYHSAMEEAYRSYLGDLPRLYEKIRTGRERAELTVMVDGLQEALEKETKMLEESLRRANESVVRGIDTSLCGAGYRKGAEHYSRRAIVDVRYSGREIERQRVKGYSYYREPELQWNERLERMLVENGSYEEAEDEYERALAEISGRRALLFGEYEGDGSSLFSRVSEKTAERFASVRGAYRAAEGDEQRKREGLFFYHVGYAPVMSGKKPGKVDRSGYGELGRIYTSFFRQEADSRRGLAMLDLAAWDRKLWDDDKNNDGKSDGWFTAPTTRQAVDIGSTALYSMLLPPGLGQVASTVVDDLIFAAADVQTGHRSHGEAGFDIGKNAAFSIASMGSSALWSGAAAPAVAGASRGLFENVLSATGSALTATGLRSGLSGITYTEESGLRYRTDTVRENLFSASSLVSVGEGVLGTIGRNALHNAFLQDTASYGFSTQDTLAMREAGEVGIDLATAVALYELEGEVSINILGTDEIFGEGRNSGLIRLTLGSDLSGGYEFAFGNSGIDLSGRRLAHTLRGTETMMRQRKIRSITGGRDDAALAEMLMRFQHSFGDPAAREALRELLNGRGGLSLGAAPGESGLWGETRMNPRGGRSFALYAGGRQGFGRSPYDSGKAAADEAALLALVMQHEAHRDGIPGEAGKSGDAHSSSGWSEELERAVFAHTRMAALISADPRYSIDFISRNPALLLDMAAVGGGGGKTSLSRLSSLYDDSADYWRLSEDGYLQWDGSHHLWGADGRLMAVHERGSFSRDIADYLGISREEALELMEQAGLRWSPEAGTYRDLGDGAGIPASEELIASYEMMKKYGRFGGGGGSSSGSSGGNGTSPRAAYAWELRQQQYAREYPSLCSGGEESESVPLSVTGGNGDRRWTSLLDARDRMLSDYETFVHSAGLGGRSSFPGITERADLRHYSQQRLEEAVTGGALEASQGNGYCLAESYGFGYVHGAASVDWDRLTAAFRRADWGAHFDPSTGYVGDKGEFTRILADELAVSIVARERRYETLEALQESLLRSADASGTLPSYSVIADYGGHFTHVRSDGLEINSYPGWSSVGKEPEEWRLVTWERMKPMLNEK